MLQHAGVISYSHLNKLKVTFDWANHNKRNPPAT
jgi:hypothetical protein